MNKGDEVIVRHQGKKYKGVIAMRYNNIGVYSVKLDNGYTVLKSSVNISPDTNVSIPDMSINFGKCVALSIIAALTVGLIWGWA